MIQIRKPHHSTVAGTITVLPNLCVHHNVELPYDGDSTPNGTSLNPHTLTHSDTQTFTKTPTDPQAIVELRKKKTVQLSRSVG